MASVADYNKDTPPTLMTSLPTDAASASALVDDGAAAKLTEILRSEVRALFPVAVAAALADRE